MRWKRKLYCNNCNKCIFYDVLGTKYWVLHLLLILVESHARYCGLVGPNCWQWPEAEEGKLVVFLQFYSKMYLAFLAEQRKKKRELCNAKWVKQSVFCLH